MAKTVLITGCSTGIGRALAIAFHAQGLSVWASARRQESLEPLAARGMNTLTLDITSAPSRHAAIRTIMDQEGRLDILVNNAGYGAMGPVVESPDSTLYQQFNTNVFAPIALIRAATPAMVAQKSGVIVNITSVSGILTTPFSGQYCASKAAFISLTEALRMELQPFGISVIDVQPGAIRSSFGDNASKTLELLPAQSIYSSIENAIKARAGASQDNPSPAEDMAQAIVTGVLKSKPPRLIRYGNGSMALPFLARWLPRNLVHRILARKFHLDRL